MPSGLPSLGTLRHETGAFSHKAYAPSKFVSLGCIQAMSVESMLGRHVREAPCLPVDNLVIHISLILA